MPPLAEIRALKNKQPGEVMTAAQAREYFAGRKQIENGSYHNVKGGKYECSKGNIYFRSMWEANRALYLDWLIQQGEIRDWEYEPERFFFDRIRMRDKGYKPDFKITRTDGSIFYEEVKGNMDPRSKTVLKRMKKYFPDIKIILIETKQYDDMYRKMKGILKFY